MDLFPPPTTSACAGGLVEDLRRILLDDFRHGRYRWLRSATQQHQIHKVASHQVAIESHVFKRATLSDQHSEKSLPFLTPPYSTSVDPLVADSSLVLSIERRARTLCHYGKYSLRHRGLT